MLVQQTLFFTRWHDRLRDRGAQARIAARIVRLTQGHFGSTRSLGAGLSEMKIDYGPGYRLYYTIRGRELVILLCGGDKSSQQADIAKAKELIESLEA
jgi:putative addiction module killer protein